MQLCRNTQCIGMMAGNATDYVQTVTLALPAMEMPYQPTPMTITKKLHSSQISTYMTQAVTQHTQNSHSWLSTWQAVLVRYRIKSQISWIMKQYQSSFDRSLRASFSILCGSEHGCHTSALSPIGPAVSGLFASSTHLPHLYTHLIQFNLLLYVQ